MIEIIQAIDKCLNYCFIVFGIPITLKMVFIGSFLIGIIGKLIFGMFEGGDSNA